MKGYVDQLEHLGYMLPQDLIVGLILNGLTKDFTGFVKSYNMHNMGKTIGELDAMLIEYEKAKGKGKANGKGKDKQVYIPKPKNPKRTAKEHPAKDDTYHHCKEESHWKRNCHVYLAELLKKKKQVGSVSSSGIFTIELCAFPNKSYVYDTGCGTNIFITKQGFREARNLKQGALYFYMGNDVRAQVEAIGSYDLVLPNGLVICLDNCHYAPSITRGVVSVHGLVENGFVQCFTDYEILVSKNNVFYFNVIPSNDNCHYAPSITRGVVSVYGLVENGFVQCFMDYEILVSKNNVFYFNVIPSNGKMTRKLFSHRPKRATDLFGITHTDVCGPLRHVSRQGASYFIIFTDDYSCYGYVYLLKHKHEGKSYFVRHGLINDESYNSVVILLELCSRVFNTHSQYGSNQEGRIALDDDDDVLDVLSLDS
nr:hypothetical protein [Tanacetum cinerariifolium]